MRTKPTPFKGQKVGIKSNVIAKEKVYIRSRQMNDEKPLPIRVNENGDIVPNYWYEVALIEGAIKDLFGLNGEQK